MNKLPPVTEKLREQIRQELANYPKTDRSEERLEAPIQADLINYFNSIGYLVINLVSSSKSGYPDLIVARDGMVCLIEVKPIGKYPRDTQIQKKDEAEARGVPCLAVTENGVEIEFGELEIHDDLGF